MENSMKIVLASNNPGKINELKALLQHFHVDLIPQIELDIADAEETGLTFVENALIKARHASCLSGLPAIADDSGLEVAALKGEPGIYSARYAGKHANADDNIQKLLSDLDHVPDEHRQAYFHCVLVYMSHDKDATPLICQGRWPGVILRAPQGQGGFGYDSIFYIPKENKTAAELLLARKNIISHRGMALQSLLTLLSEKI
jgi:XTP/dITP diphosphohydrolase